jgi:hypothetical protein
LQTWVLESETQVRKGSVLLTRGAASILGIADLAAIAKGHGAGLGQAILSLEPTPEDVQECPIGIAAWVDFPEIDVIDLLRAPQALTSTTPRPRARKARVDARPRNLSRRPGRR